MNNYKNYGQVSDEITKVMDELIECTNKTSAKKIRSIKDVSLYAIVLLFRTLPPGKRLWLPGELGNDKMTIVYKPAENCIITIESEPLHSHEVKLQNKLINLN